VNRHAVVLASSDLMLAQQGLRSGPVDSAMCCMSSLREGNELNPIAFPTVVHPEPEVPLGLEGLPHRATDHDLLRLVLNGQSMPRSDTLLERRQL
jgi:hypothetical protein